MFLPPPLAQPLQNRCSHQESYPVGPEVCDTDIVERMSGRYAFSMPDPRQRDGWFKVGNIDVTTTALLVGVGLISMFLYALSPDLVFKAAFNTQLVRDGEIWRLATWPLVGVPDFFVLIGLAVFWFFGHNVEEKLGRVPYTWLIVAMTILPAVVVTLAGLRNEGFNQWEVSTAGLHLLSLGMLVIFALETPNAPFFFSIPAWVIAAAIVGINVLSDLGARAWGSLWMLLLAIAVGCIGARQRGLLSDSLGFVPTISWLSGPTPSPYGHMTSSAKKSKRPKRPGRKGASASNRPTVVAGPWQSSNGPTPLEQAELDVLLDRISESGLASLSKSERARLEELSRRLRDN